MACGGQADAAEGRTQTPYLAVRRLQLRHSLDGKPCFSVQYHPEASPGPRDSHYLFKRFCGFDAGKEGRLSATAMTCPVFDDSERRLNTIWVSLHWSHDGRRWICAGVM